MCYFCVIMKKEYRHLSFEQRYTIYRLLRKGETQTSIAQTIGVHKSTVSREIARNKTEKKGVYHHKTADKYTKERKAWRKRRIKFTSAMKQRFANWLVESKWSPEQIVGRCRLLGLPMVGKTTLYTFLHQDKRAGGTLYRSCRHALKYNRKRLSAPTKWGCRKSIESRPRLINKEARMGDFEMDTIIGATQKGAILTITDRKTDFAIIEKLKSGKNAKELAKVVAKRMAYLKRRNQLFSITTDNGTEFSRFKEIERALKIPVFFAKPYCSSDKPHIEHLNALIRQYIPKGKEFTHITDKQIRKIEKDLNNRPRKKLNYKTPNEVFLFNL